MLQLDSVSVAVRAHYAPVFSRLGPYDRDVLDRAAWGPRSSRLLAEYWAHEAALMAVDDWPLLRWRMRQYRHGRWGTHIVKANPQLAEDIVAAVAELGPSTAGQIEAHLAAEPRRKKGTWWDIAATPSGSPRRCSPPACSPPPPGSASPATTTWWSGCCRRACWPARSTTTRPSASSRCGPPPRWAWAPRPTSATTSGCRPSRSSRRSPTWLAAGEIERVDVDGWSAPAYLRAGRTVPRRDRGTALLCPFDPLIFFRPRVERLFGFHYRIEIYTPAAKRQYGYYVWPLLLDGQLVARVDLKADRAADTLRVVGAFGEPGR